MLDELESAQAEQCRRSFFRFFCYFWSEIEAGKLVLSWHIRFLCDFLQGVGERLEQGIVQDDVLINIAFGLSKSTILQLFEAWLLLRNPSFKILGTSYAAKISIKNAGKVRECLKSKKFQRFFPGKVVFGEIDGKTQFETKAKGIYYTSSTGGAATGMHSHAIVDDDPLSAKHANSKAKRESANEYKSGTLSSRKAEEYTVTITVMQRLHVDDPSDHLLEKKQLQHVCLPVYIDASNRHLVKPQAALAYYDAHGGYLSPERFGDAKIQRFKVDLGPYAFAAQVQQNPLDDSSGIFKKGNFEIITWEQFQVVTAGAKVTWDTDLDTALTDDRANDPTGFLSSCTVDGTTYIREFHAGWLAYEDLLDHIPKFLNRNGRTTDTTLYVEGKANGKSVIDSMVKRGKVLVKEAPTPVKDKTARAHEVLAYVYANNVKLIDGQWIIAFLQELTTFPNAPHDEAVDCLTQCLARAIGLGKKKKVQMRVY